MNRQMLISRTLIALALVGNGSTPSLAGPGGHGGGGHAAGGHGGAVGGHGGGAHVGIMPGGHSGHPGFGYGPGHHGYYGGYYGYPYGVGIGFGYGVGFGLGYGYYGGYGVYSGGYPYGLGYAATPYYGIPYGYGSGGPFYLDPNYGYPAPGYYPAAPGAPGSPPASSPNPDLSVNGTPMMPPSTAATTLTMLVSPASNRDSENDVTLIVLTPPEAIVWINGQRTSQTGSHREFVSAGPAPGRIYTFHVRAQWTSAGGNSIDISRTVSLVASEKRTIDFATNPAEAKH
jgi:uncharacterized protein (TIGR03000 family)